MHGLTLSLSLALWRRYFADFGNYFSQQVANVRLPVVWRDWVQLFAFKGFWFYLHVILAVQYSHSYSLMFFNLVLHLGVAAHYMENIFIVNHIQPGLVPPEHLHWANRQVMSTINWKSASHAWNIISGGLNHQIEHHLFPAMSHYLYPRVAPIVKATCHEFNLPYSNFDSFGEAWMSMITYLRDLGTDKYDVFIHKKQQ